MEKSEHLEKRKSSRAVFQQTNWILSLQWALENTLAHPPRIQPINISLHGMKILANFKIPLFEIVKIQLLDKQSKDLPLQVQGKVVRVEETDTGKREKLYGLALEFENLPAEVQKKIIALTD